MEAFRKLRHSFGTRSVVRTLALTATLILLPAAGNSQGPPPGGGDCEACATGDHCVPNEWGQYTCYTGATFCAHGTLWGWYTCSDNPPYGSCTVGGGACETEGQLTAVPDGILGASTGILLVSEIPCALNRRSTGAIATAQWLDVSNHSLRDAQNAFVARLTTGLNGDLNGAL
jgi:hypothetical protein